MVIQGGKEAVEKVSNLLKGASWACLAVAYWGDGAIQRLGLRRAAKRADVRIALDLMSGACNPNEVRRLLGVVGKGNVVAVERLHAKVWITDKGALIGSSNASANGFGHEGDDPEIAGLIEANIAFSPLPAQASRAWCRWFEREIWNNGQAITEAMLREAERRWRAKRARRDVDAAASAPAWASLLARLRTDPAFFRDKLLSIWIRPNGGLTKPAQQRLKAEQKARHNPELSCYEGRKLKPGETILDFDTSDTRINVDGLWQAAKDRPHVRLKGTSISLVYEVSHFDGLTLRGDKQAWKDAVAAVLDDSRRRSTLFVSAEKFAELLAKAERH